MCLKPLHEPGGVLIYGIPAFRLPKTVLDDFEYRHLRLKGIKVRPNTDVGKALKIEDLFRDGYKAIFIGTGVWRPNTLHIKGESLGNVHYAINYLQNPDVYHLGNRVIVIGAGNAAMDVARTALRKGVRQLTCFSRTPEVAASQHEFSYATLEGVNFEYCKAPVEITDEGVIFVDVREDENGEFIEAPGTEKLYPADSVIVSISQGPRNRIVSTTKGIDTDRRGLLVTDEEGHTTRPGVFASGDVVLGAKTVVQAVAYSKRVAEAMHSYMQGIPAQGRAAGPTARSGSACRASAENNGRSVKAFAFTDLLHTGICGGFISAGSRPHRKRNNCRRSSFPCVCCRWFCTTPAQRPAPPAQAAPNREDPS